MKNVKSNYIILSHFCTVRYATLCKIRQQEMVDTERLYEYTRGQKNETTKQKPYTRYASTPLPHSPFIEGIV